MRHRLISMMALGAFLASAGSTALGAAAPANVTLNWLDHSSPPARDGVSWGVPWPQGKIQKDTALTLRLADGRAVPLQTWPLAYWPDGSLKWTGHAISATPDLPGPLELSTGAPTAPANPVTAVETASKIEIASGPWRCVIPKTGNALFESLQIGNRTVSENARLVLQMEDRSEKADKGIIREVNYTSRLDRVTLEQAGPVRAVVKIEGAHFSESASRALLPFVVRLYFYAGDAPMRIVHSFVFNGDDKKDFIKGLGIAFTVPFAEETQNRHIRFAGDGTGVWVQPVLLLPGYRGRVSESIYDAQLAGQRTPNLADYNNATQQAILTCPVWGDAKLFQPNPNGFTIAKRTTDQSAWLHVTDGRRAQGLAALGDVSGGIVVALKNFWQRGPAELEIRHAGTPKGELTCWFWSPESEAMDLRTYDTVPHDLSVNYEDWKAGWGTPYGVANTHELTLWPFAAVPSDAEMVAMAKTNAETPLLVCSPHYYHSVPVFGYWSLPDRTDPVKRWVEDQVAGFIDFYRRQIEERQWYGFWDYGDVMHNYDFGRHEWRYDIGGWAWTNDELAPTMLLWTQFLRTGDPQIFRMAENMARKNSEVTVHHLGVFYPLGSRHNVNAWGDGAKQPRISQAGFKRYYYYFTTDERTGDLMREQLTANLAYDYIRYIDPRSGRGANQPFNADGTLDVTFENPAWVAAKTSAIPPSNSAFGLDWTCYAINWTTEWERSGQPAWRDLVLYMMRNVTPDDPQAPLRGGNYFDIIFGGLEIMAELEPMYDYPEFWNAWANSCEQLGARVQGNEMTGPRLSAYAAFVKKDPALGLRAWTQLLGDSMPTLPAPALINGPNVVNPVHDPVFLGRFAGWQLHGPASVQWCLNALETLSLAGDYLPQWEAAQGVPPSP